MAKGTAKRTSASTGRISELVGLHVKHNPFLRHAVLSGVVNFSALARKIATDTLKQPAKSTAVKMALLRLSASMQRQEQSLQSPIRNVLHQTTLSLRNKVAVVISKNRIPQIESFSYAESKSAVTYLVEENELERLKKNKVTQRSLLRTDTRLNVITLHSPVDLEETPGVVAHVLSALALEGINVLEVISCYTDTLLVFQEADTPAAFGILSKLTE